MQYDPLIYGKSQEENIVSIEIQDDKAIVFREISGEIYQDTFPNKFWILTSDSRSGWSRLKGNLHYNRGKQFSTREEFENTRNALRNKDIYSIWDPKEAFMVREGFSYFKGMNIADLSILSFDTESTSLEYSPKEKLLLITNTFRKGGQIERKMFAYDEFPSPKEMIEAWCKWVREKNPSLLIGHNILGHDFNYLSACAKHHDTDLFIGRDGSPLTFAKYESKFRKDQTQFISYKKVKIFGRETCDTFFTSIKHDVVQKKYDSYGLKPIIAAEGLEDKDRVHYDASQIRFKYHIPEEWEKIKEYGQFDADDPLKLFDLQVPPLFYFCQSVPKSFSSLIESASGSQLNSIFVRSYLQDGHSIPKADQISHFPGALSWGNPGIYSNALKWDVASLYPSLMLQYQIYPKHKDPNGHILTILDYFTKERLKNKQIASETKSKYHKDLSEAEKIVCNSAYGLLGTNGLNFNSLADATEVTKLGRETLKQAILWATGKSYEEWNPEENSSDRSEGSEELQAE